MKRLCLVIGLMMLGTTPVAAQQAEPGDATSQVGLDAPLAEPQTLADIRTELAELKAQIDGLRAELALNDPAVSGVVNTAPVLERVDTLEEDLRRLTAQVEELAFRVERIVADGTNRIGDLEFRLLELEGGDFGSLGETVPLGQGDTAARNAPAAGQGDGSSPAEPPRSGLSTVRPLLRGQSAASGGAETPPAVPQTGTPPPEPPEPQPQPPQSDLAEEAFQAALAAFRSGDYFRADRAFAEYLATYPGSTRAGEAAFWRGESLAAQNDWQTAARSFLDSFSGSPDGPYAADALHRLGVALGRIGQLEQACRTLSEVPRRYPGLTSDLASRVEAERAALACP